MITPRGIGRAILRTQPLGTQDAGICAECGVQVSDESPYLDEPMRNVYCSEEHYLQGVADRTW